MAADLTDEETERFRNAVAHFVGDHKREVTVARELYGENDWDLLDPKEKNRLSKAFADAVRKKKFPEIYAVPRREWKNQRNHQEYRRVNQ